MIERNDVLARRRSEIAAELYPLMSKLIELQDNRATNEAAVYRAHLQQELAVLFARWEEFYRTLEATVRHPAWAP